MPPECEEIEERSAPEKISCIEGRIKDPLQFVTPVTICGRRAMINKFWCHDLTRKWFHKKDEPPHPWIFTEPRCQNYVATWYLLYRWLIFMAWTCIIVCSIFEFGSYNPTPAYDKWPIYLTNWDLVLGLCQAFLGGYLVSRRWKLQRESELDSSTLMLGLTDRVYWFLYVVTTNIAIGVTISYWCSVYDPKIHHLDPLNIMLHVCNSILMITDFCITSVPFRLRNFWWCLIIVFFYVMFSIIYYVAGGLDKHGYHYIYKILDWKKPVQSSLICLGQAIFITILYSIICLLEKLKNQLYFKIGKKMKGTEIQISTVEKRVDIV